MPQQNQNSDERKGGAVKRKLEAMDTNDGASSKQAAEDVRPQVRREKGSAKKRMHFVFVFSSLSSFDSHALLLLSLLFSSRRLPSLALFSARVASQ